MNVYDRVNEKIIIKKKIYIYIYGKSASRFSRGTVLNTLNLSRINIMRGKKGRNYISHFGKCSCVLFSSHNIYIYTYIYIYIYLTFAFGFN